MFASVAAILRLGLAAAGVASAVFALAVAALDGFASLFSARTGTTAMARTRRVDRDFLHVNMDDISSSNFNTP
jgi:hypothetical protein